MSIQIKSRMAWSLPPTSLRELTDLAALGVLMKSGQGRGTGYALSGALEGVSG